MATYLDRFFDAYVECALWASSDSEGDDTPLDEIYGPEDIAPATNAAMWSDCAHFVRRACMEARENWTAEQAGHNFWLTRNGHGAGFWDRDQPDGEELTALANVWGSVDLYVGDDGRIHST